MALFIQIRPKKVSPVTLKNSNINDGADNVHQTYRRNLSAVAADGGWTLPVVDRYGQDVSTGYTFAMLLSVMTIGPAGLQEPPAVRAGGLPRAARCWRRGSAAVVSTPPHRRPRHTAGCLFALWLAYRTHMII